MTVINLPSGTSINFEDASEEQIEESLALLQKNQPDLFSEKSVSEEDYIASLTTDQAIAYAEAKSKDQSSTEFQPTNDVEVIDFETRFEFGKADRADEKEAALTRIFGPDSFGVSPQGDYYLKLDNISPEIKASKKLPETGTMWVNKPGGGFLGLFNMPDVYQFLGQYRGELLGGTGAAMLAGPLGLFGASLLIGTGAGLGKYVDEVIETKEGIQLQPRSEVIGDAATAFAWNSLGNLFLGGLFKGLGRVIKGPGNPDAQVISNLRDQGMSESAARAAAVQMQRTATRADIAAGGRPTISDATGKAIMGRMQGIHEAIFPNKSAARQNRQYIQSLMKQYENGSLGPGALKQALDQNAKDVEALIRNAMKDPDEAVKLANQHLRDVIGEELNLIMKNYVPDDQTSAFMLQSLERSVRMWQQNNKTLYGHADDALDNMRIFDAGGLRKKAAQMTSDDLAKQMGLDKDPIFQYIAGKKDDYTLSELHALRTLVQNGRSSNLVGNAQDHQLKKLSDELDRMFDSTEALVNYRIAERVGTYGDLGIPIPPGSNAGTIVPQQKRDEYLKKVAKGLGLWRDAQAHYKTGAEQFKSGAIDMFNKNIREGFAPDLLSVSELVIQNNKPEFLKNYLKSVTPEGSKIGLIQKVPQSEWNLMAQAAEAGNINEINRLLQKNFFVLSRKTYPPGETGSKDLRKLGLSFKPAEFVEKLPENDPFRMRYLDDLAETFRNNAEDAFYRAAPDAQRNINRDMLAGAWMQNAQQRATTLDVFDPTHFKRSFDDLGKNVQDELFGKAKAAELRATFKDLSLMGQNPITGNLNFVDVAASAINNSTMRDIVSNLQKVILEANEQSTNALFKAVKSGQIVDAESLVQSAVKSPTLLDDLMRSVPQGTLNQPAGFKDAVMARIMKEAFPDGVTEAAVSSGAWQDAMQAAIFNMNQRGALTKILGQDVVDDLVKMTKIKISDKAIKGKGGIVSAAYAAGIGMRVLAEPISGLASVAGVYASGRILRDPRFLKLMTRPSIAAKDYRRGVRALTEDLLRQAESEGITLTRSQARAQAEQEMGRLSVIGLRLKEIAAAEARLFAFTGASGTTTAEDRRNMGQAISEVVEPVRPVISRAMDAARPAIQNVQQQINPLRQIEINKLMTGRP
tara:strand:- start:4561 stop:7989 length:3429 start_codon:yes stop_codon:yes gene_type:complete